MIKIMSFFFQAEDGIRDIGVTGVQTCALPILARSLGSGAGTTENPACSRAAATSSTRAGDPEIGRASCRERELIAVGAASNKKKEKKHRHQHSRKKTTEHTTYTTSHLTKPLTQ